MKIISANITLLLVFFSATIAGLAQQNDTIADRFRPEWKQFRKTEILIGLDWMGNWKDKDNKNTLNYYEIGIARSVHAYGRHGPVSLGVYISEEMHFGDKNIYGTKVGVYTHYLFDLGVALIYYTDFKKANFKLRPELGLGLGPLRFVGGFNIPTIANKSFPELRNKNAHMAVQWMLPVKKNLVDSKGPIVSKLF